MSTNTSSGSKFKSGLFLGFDARSEAKIGKPYDWIKIAYDHTHVSQQDFYRHCEIILQPSDTKENWPRIGFEAMSSGSVLIVDNRGGWKRIVEHGKTGWLCDHERDFIYYASRMAYEPNMRSDMAAAARERSLQLGGLEGVIGELAGRVRRTFDPARMSAGTKMVSGFSSARCCRRSRNSAYGPAIWITVSPSNCSPTRGTPIFPQAPSCATLRKSYRRRMCTRTPGGSLSSWWEICSGYTLLHKEGGFWTDMDMVCLKPQLPDTLPWFARQDAETVALGVIGFPQGHPAMETLMRLAYDPAETAPWDGNAELMRKAQWRTRVPDVVKRRIHTEWGAAGPILFTRTMAHYELLDKAAPAVSVYPIHWSVWRRCFDGHMTLDAPVFADAWAVHLWFEMVRREPDAFENISVNSVAWRAFRTSLSRPARRRNEGRLSQKKGSAPYRCMQRRRVRGAPPRGPRNMDEPDSPRHRVPVFHRQNQGEPS